MVRDGLKDNRWVSNSVSNPVDATAFKKRKTIREGNEKYSENIKMEILAEGALDKVLTVPGKIIDAKQPYKILYKVIDDEQLEESDIELSKHFLLKCKKEYNVSHFILFNGLVLRTVCFDILLKLNEHLLKKQTSLPKKPKI